MSRPSEDYTRCPDCKRRTVLFHFGKGGDDYLRCTRTDCWWETFRFPEAGDTSYGPETEKWETLNGIVTEATK